MWYHNQRWIKSFAYGLRYLVVFCSTGLELLEAGLLVVFLIFSEMMIANYYFCTLWPIQLVIRQ